MHLASKQEKCKLNGFLFSARFGFPPQHQRQRAVVEKQSAAGLPHQSRASPRGGPVQPRARQAVGGELEGFLTELCWGVEILRFNSAASMRRSKSFWACWTGSRPLASTRC